MQHAQVAWLFQDWPGFPRPGASADYATVSNNLKLTGGQIVEISENRRCSRREREYDKMIKKMETFEGRLKRYRIYRNIEVYRELNKSGERGGVMITEGKN